MSLRSDSSGKANGFSVSANRVKRSSSSSFGTSLRGRGPHSLGPERSLREARWLGVVASCGRFSLGNERSSASFKVARGAVAFSASPDSPSANRSYPLRCVLRSESGRFGRQVAASVSVTLVSRVRERVSSASSFARSARCGLQPSCARTCSVPNKPLVATGSGEAPAPAPQRRRWVATREEFDPLRSCP
jgi:hypothetical protein